MKAALIIAVSTVCIIALVLLALVWRGQTRPGEDDDDDAQPQPAAMRTI